MLGGNDEGVANVDAFEAIACLVELPTEWTGFFDQSDAAQAQYDDHRRFPRKNLRTKAIIERRGGYSGVYTKDFSRSGIGFYFHEQLFPLEEVYLFLPNTSKLHLRCACCKRIKDMCFQCGMVFVDETPA